MAVIDQRFVILGALIGFGTVIVYVRDTLRGRTQPNRVTWLLWGLAPMLAFAAELNDHVGLGSLMTFSVGFNPLLVLAASFVNPHGSWHIGTFDYLCGGLSLLGTIAWIATSNSDVALTAAIVADGLAALPTVRKALINPASESGAIFAGGIVNGSITLLAARRFDAAHIAFPLYIVLVNLALTVILIRGARPTRSGRRETCADL